MSLLLKSGRGSSKILDIKKAVCESPLPASVTFDGQRPPQMDRVTRYGLLYAEGRVRRLYLKTYEGVLYACNRVLQIYVVPWGSKSEIGVLYICSGQSPQLPTFGRITEIYRTALTSVQASCYA
jgi:hypothetical protein